MDFWQFLEEKTKTHELGKPEELDAIPHKLKKGEDHWGQHLLVSASGGNKNIDDKKAVETFLKQMVKTLKMKSIGEPIVIKVDSPEGRGVSGIQMITTSNLAFHGDNQRWIFFFDAFSCEDFDVKPALDLIKQTFEPKDLSYKIIYRDAGRWPRKKEKEK